MSNKVISNYDFAGVVLTEHYNLNETTFELCDFRGAIFPASPAEMAGIEIYNSVIDPGTLREFNRKFEKDYRIYILYSYRIDGKTEIIEFSLAERVYPKEDLIVYKILRNAECGDFVLATLRIRRDVPSVIIPGDKCRAASAEVLAIRDRYGNAYSRGRSCFNPMDKELEYVVGREVVADSFDPDDTTVCTQGIHFFLTEKEAWDYWLRGN